MARWPKWFFQGTRQAAEDAEHERQRLSIDGIHASRRDHLYACLTILDTKAAALLQFDGVLIATSAILLALKQGHATATVIALVIALVLSVASCGAILKVIWVVWTDVEQLKTPDEYLEHLLEVRDSRTLWYRGAWLVAALAVLAVLVGAISLLS